METFFAVIIIMIILSLAVFYIYRAKKSGQKCIGCPYAKDCSKNNCSCNNDI